MSALAEKMKAAGIDTTGSQLSAACFEAIRRHPESAVDAWRYVGEVFGHEFVRQRMKDMRGSEPKREPRSPSPQPSPPIVSPKPYTPRFIAPERLEQRHKLQEVVRSKYKNSGGINWSDVPWNELRMMKRDGKEAEALLAACQAQVPTNDWNLTVGQVLSVTRVDEIIADVRARA